MRVVLTGGAGFIGANLCRTLSRTSDHEIVVLDDLSTGFSSNLEGTTAELVVGSILDAALVDETIRDAGAVVHLAARPSVPRSLADPMASHLANATGTIEVLEAARRESARAGKPVHVVVASSSSVYGATDILPKSEDLPTSPVSPYAASKLATEAYAVAYQRSFGLPVLCFRFFNVFGPLQAAGHAYAAVIPAFVSAALAGQPLVVHGDGLQSRDFTFVDTVTAVITDAIGRRVTFDSPVNLAFGTRTDLMTVIARLEALIGEPLAVDHTDPRPGDVRHSQADWSRLKKLFPDVDPVSLHEGLEATVEWFRSQ